MIDDDRPKAKKAAEFPRNLVDMSVGEIEEYIGELKGEIERAEGDIARKKASQAAAASFFKS